MHKHIKNFGRELAFLLVVIMVMSSGGLQAFAAVAPKDEGAIVKAKSTNGAIPYKEGGYTRASLVSTLQAMAKSVPWLSDTDTHVVSTVGTFAYNNGTSILAKNVKVGKGGTLTTIATLTIKYKYATTTNLVREAKQYISDTDTSVLTSVKDKNTIEVPYLVGGYANQTAIAAKVKGMLDADFAASPASGAKVATSTSSEFLRARKLQGVTASVSAAGSNTSTYNLVLKAGAGQNIKREYVTLTVIPASITSTDYLKEAINKINGPVEVPYTSTADAITISDVREMVHDVLAAKLTETSVDYNVKTGQRMDLGSATVTEVQINPATKKWSAKVHTNGDFDTLTSARQAEHTVTMAVPSTQTLIDLASATFTTTSTFSLAYKDFLSCTGTTATIKKMEAEARTRVDGYTAGWYLPVSLTGVTVKVTYSELLDQYSLTLSKGGTSVIKKYTAADIVPVTTEAEKLLVLAAAKAAIGATVVIPHKAYPGYADTASKTAVAVEKVAAALTAAATGANVELKNVIPNISTYTVSGALKYALTLTYDGPFETIKPVAINIKAATPAEKLADAFKYFSSTGVEYEKGLNTRTNTASVESTASAWANKQLLPANFPNADFDMSGVSAAVKYQPSFTRYDLELTCAGTTTKLTKTGITMDEATNTPNKQAVLDAMSKISSPIQIAFNSAAALPNAGTVTKAEKITAYNRRASMATEAVKKILAQNSLSDVTAVVKNDNANASTLETYTLKLTKGTGANLGSTTMNVKVEMEDDPDIAIVDAARDLIDDGVEIDYIAEEDITTDVKIDALLAKITEMFAETAEEDYPDDVSGVEIGEIVTTSETDIYAVPLSKGLIETVTTVELTIGDDKNIQLAIDAAAYIGSGIVIPYGEYPAGKEDQKAAAAEAVIEAYLADAAPLYDGVTVAIEWISAKKYYNLTVQAGAESNNIVVLNFVITIAPDVTTLEAAILTAEGVLEAAEAFLQEAGTQPGEVLEGTEYYLPSDLEAFEDKIDAAKAVLTAIVDDPHTALKQKAVTDAVAALEQAITDFEAALREGTMPWVAPAILAVPHPDSDWITDDTGAPLYPFVEVGGKFVLVASITPGTDSFEPAYYEWYRVEHYSGEAELIASGNSDTVTDYPEPGVYYYMVVATDWVNTASSQIQDVLIVVPQPSEINDVELFDGDTLAVGEEITLTVDAEGEGNIYFWCFIDWDGNGIVLINPDGSTVPEYNYTLPTTPGTYGFQALVLSKSLGLTFSNVSIFTVE